jgi:hypothetical protein
MKAVIIGAGFAGITAGSITLPPSAPTTSHSLQVLRGRAESGVSHIYETGCLVSEVSGIGISTLV